MNQAEIDLRGVRFAEREAVLATFAGLTATCFSYASGIAGIRIANDLGHIDLLPFQGQQIWDAEFLGRRLTMGSMFPEPVATEDYLSTYGAFFIHCGATAMGNPGPGDSHPLHAELPNARYQEASLILGSDEEGPYMGLTGTYRHRVAFTHNYQAQPTVKLYQGSSRIRATFELQNLRPTAMELMYLAHINFRPWTGAVLVDTVPDDPKHMRVRTGGLQGAVVSPEHRAMIERLRTDPGAHRRMARDGAPGGAADPEIVLAMDCRADDAGWAHSLQVLPDGGADFVSHRPAELAHAVRWIARNGEEDALGLMLPATAEADGYTAEKAKGHVRTIPSGGWFRCSLAFGALDAPDAEGLRRRIETVARR